MPPNVSTRFSTPANIAELLPEADLVIGAVLIAGARAPHLIRKQDLKTMKAGSVLVDVAVDQGGCIEVLERPNALRFCSPGPCMVSVLICLSCPDTSFTPADLPAYNTRHADLRGGRRATLLRRLGLRLLWRMFSERDAKRRARRTRPCMRDHVRPAHALGPLVSVPCMPSQSHQCDSFVAARPCACCCCLSLRIQPTCPEQSPSPRLLPSTTPRYRSGCSSPMKDGSPLQREKA